MKKIIKLSGIETSTPNRLINIEHLEVSQTYEITTKRGQSKNIERKYDKEEMVEIVFEDGSTWIGMTMDLPDKFDSQFRGDDGIFELPEYIPFGESQRGFFDTLKIKLISFFVSKLSEYTAEKLGKIIDDFKNSSPGLYIVENDFKHNISFNKKEYINATKKGPWLIFLHGTNSNFKGSFLDLYKNNISNWNKMYRFYEGRILALEHHTLTVSPIQNAIDLMKELPDDMEIHFITHSRGGIIGDIISRYHMYNEIKYDSNNKEKAVFEKNEYNQLDEDDKRLLKELNEVAENKNLNISKYIRVACPAGGTQLLSKNLDDFFNTLNNLFGLNGKSLVAQAVGIYVIEFIKQKSNADILPGLKAMIPDNKFLAILNSPDKLINSKLAVIYANSNYKGSVLKAVIYFITNRIFREDNDFVVDTKSMFLGANRSTPLRSLLVSGNKITHTQYFENDTVRIAILDELTRKQGSIRFIDTSSYESERGVGPFPGGKSYPYKKPSGNKPIVILLPGIMGSVLSEDNDMYWLDYGHIAWYGVKKLRLDGKYDIKATHVIKSAYNNIIDCLTKEGYDVAIFPFDWRKSVKEAGQLLNKRINEYLKLGQPIKVLAHSMGGLVIRDIMIHHTATYDKLANHRDYKLVMLGVPWLGSYLIMQILTGQGRRFSSIKRIATFHKKKVLLDAFSKYPGVHELLPFTPHNDKDFTTVKFWEEIFKKDTDDDWVVPNMDMVKHYNAYKKSVLGKTFNFDNVIYVAGRSGDTVDDYYFEKDRLCYKPTVLGDGSVTWKTGIPEGINKNDVYYVNVAHGDLADNKSIFDGIKDLLIDGKTNQETFSHNKPRPLPVEQYGIRGGSGLPAHPILPNNYEDLERILLGKSILTYPSEAITNTTLEIDMICADLRMAKYPVMASHFSNDNLMGAENAINGLLNGELDRLLKVGLYPNIVESSRFVSSGNNRRFKGGIIVGLGEKEKITGYQLEKSVEKAVIDYALSQHNDYCNPIRGHIGISTVLMSSYYGKLTVLSSLEAIINGILKANKYLYEVKIDISFNKLEIIELYEDRAIDIFFKLLTYENKNNEIQLNPKLIKKAGRRLKLPSNHDAEWYHRLSIHKEVSKKKQDIIVFKSSDGFATEKTYKEFSNHHYIDQLSASISKKWDNKINKTLFELLIPNEFKSIFRRNSNLMLVLDKETAYIPWEMMATSLTGKPISVASSMIRQFSTESYNSKLNFIKENNAYIIGNPDTKGKHIDLPGAEAEARGIINILEKDFDIKTNIDKEFSPIDYILELASNVYKIVHIAAHGIYKPSKKGSPSTAKIVIGPKKKDVITPTELCHLPYTPEIAFINCCYVGEIRPKRKNKSMYADRHRLASSIGEQLLREGYKAVIVAGWAVHDGAAKIFAEEFYTQLLAGKYFGDAVTSARNKCWDKYPDKNTWGAFQCYGDAEYLLVENKHGQNSNNRSYHIPFEAEIDLRNFLNNARFIADYITKLDDLESISKKIGKSNFREDAQILELEAECYVEIMEWEKAEKLYQKLLRVSKAKYSFKAIETYYNIKIRNIYNKAKNEKINNGMTLINKGIKDIKRLKEIANTKERYSLLGSAYQRKYALKGKEEDLVAMQENYKKAFLIEKSTHIRDYQYPLITFLKANYLLNPDKKLDKTLDNLMNDKIKLITNIDIIDHLQTELISIQNGEDIWDEIALMSLYQYKLFSSSKKGELEELCGKICTVFDQAWELGGTDKERSTELEHLDFLKKGVEIKLEGKRRSDILNVIKKIRDKVEGL